MTMKLIKINKSLISDRVSVNNTDNTFTAIIIVHRVSERNINT